MKVGDRVELLTDIQFDDREEGWYPEGARATVVEVGTAEFLSENMIDLDWDDYPSDLQFKHMMHFRVISPLELLAEQADERP